MPEASSAPPSMDCAPPTPHAPSPAKMHEAPHPHPIISALAFGMGQTPDMPQKNTEGSEVFWTGTLATCPEGVRAGCGQPESKPGGREPPPAWPWGVRWAELASDNEPNFVLARGCLP